MRLLLPVLLVLAYIWCCSVGFNLEVEPKLWGDNARYHLGDFRYIASSLRHGWGFPRWYPWDGGVPVGMMSINFYHSMPYRILAYLLYA